MSHSDQLNWVCLAISSLSQELCLRTTEAAVEHYFQSPDSEMPLWDLRAHPTQQNWSGRLISSSLGESGGPQRKGVRPWAEDMDDKAQASSIGVNSMHVREKLLLLPVKKIELLATAQSAQFLYLMLCWPENQSTNWKERAWLKNIHIKLYDKIPKWQNNTRVGLPSTITSPNEAPGN